MKRLLFIIMLLAGCQQNQSNSEAPPEQNQPEGAPETSEPIDPPTLITDGGVIVYWEAESSIRLPERDTLDRWWTEVQQCLSMPSDTPPTVYIIMDVNERFGVTGANAYWAGPDEIYINRSSSKIRRTWKHEFIHDIMDEHERYEHYDHEPLHLWQCRLN